MRSWLEIALSWTVVRRSLLYAVVVGAILIVINHGDVLLHGEITLSRILEMGLTVIVPYLVSTFSSVGALRDMEARMIILEPPDDKVDSSRR